MRIIKETDDHYYIQEGDTVIFGIKTGGLFRPKVIPEKKDRLKDRFIQSYTAILEIDDDSILLKEERTGHSRYINRKSSFGQFVEEYVQCT